MMENELAFWFAVFFAALCSIGTWKCLVSRMESDIEAAPILLVIAVACSIIAHDMRVYTLDEQRADFESEYLNVKQEYTMLNCDWEQHFKDAAYNSKLRRWHGGDEERGELLNYYAGECDSEPKGSDSFMIKRKYHGLIDPYCSTGLCGWDGVIEYPRELRQSNE